MRGPLPALRQPSKMTLGDCFVIDWWLSNSREKHYLHDMFRPSLEGDSSRPIHGDDKRQEDEGRIQQRAAMCTQKINSQVLVDLEEPSSGAKDGHRLSDFDLPEPEGSSSASLVLSSIFESRLPHGRLLPLIVNRFQNWKCMSCSEGQVLGFYDGKRGQCQVWVGFYRDEVF